MNEKAKLFYDIGEPMAAGLFEDEKASDFERFSRALRRFWEYTVPAEYDGGPLYPCGVRITNAMGAFSHHSISLICDYNYVSSKSAEAGEILKTYPTPFIGEYVEGHGGGGYTHSIPHYERVLKEGFDGYAERIKKMKDASLRNGLLDLLEGVKAYHKRILDTVIEKKGEERLIEALKQVPFKPARNYYEAIVCWNFIFYIDVCDNPGLLDRGLYPYYKGEDMTDVLRAFFTNVEINDGWTAALGPDYNPVTVQCLKAIKGIRKPNLELRVTDAVTDEMWELATESLVTGCGQPAFYNEAGIQKMLTAVMPDESKDDIFRFCGGGCTETMFAGISNIGSLDGGVNIAYVLAEYMRAEGEGKTSFKEFYEGYLEKAREASETVMKTIDDYRRYRAKTYPHPMRTLLIDDCIEKEVEYNAGGARINGSVFNIAGMINCIDSLLAVKKLVFEDKYCTLKEMNALLDAGDAAFYAKLKGCPHFGQPDDEINDFAHEFSDKILSVFYGRRLFANGYFLPASIQFNTYVFTGSVVKATPDGRKAFEPLCDCIAPLNSRQTGGPSAVMESASHICQQKFTGIPVLNLRLSKKTKPETVKALVKGYFELGGLQVQISCMSQEELKDALVRPECHEDLVVRIGGYSEYFNRLSSRELKEDVIKRNEY